MASHLTWSPLAGAAVMPSGLILTPERQIPTSGGAVFHALKQTSAGFKGFGEAYFSLVDSQTARDWKCHSRMTLNLVVPVGKVAFLLARRVGTSWVDYHYAVLGSENYARLTVSPGWFMTFVGLGPGQSLLMNLADIVHDPDEAERLEAGFGPRLPDTKQLTMGRGPIAS